jgi:hypothetical protein
MASIGQLSDPRASGCPRCGELNLLAEAVAARCVDCGVCRGLADGVVDFVAGRESTKLDDIDDDALSMISDDPSPLSRELKNSVAGRWRATLESGPVREGRPCP